MDEKDQLNDLQRAASDSAIQHARGAMAVLLEPNESEDISSGTLFSTSRGYVVLTAKHCVEEYDRHWDQVHVGVGRGSDGNYLVKDWSIHPEPEVDVAIVRLVDQEELPGSLEPASAQSPPDDYSGDAALLMGCPAAEVKWNKKIGRWGGKGVFVRHYLSHASEIEVEADGRWSLPWGPALHDPVETGERVHPAWQAFIEARDRALEGRVLDPIPMPGMSGGALWLIDQTTNTEPVVWSPADSMRLVGVQSAYNAGTCRALIEPWARWGEWFRSELL